MNTIPTTDTPATNDARSSNDRRDLVILGGGLVGMTLALAAARKGLTSHVVERADPETLTAAGADGRASAISTASWNLFGHIGLAEKLEPLGCPIESIAVSDGMKPGRIDFQPGPEEGTLGRMFANRDLRLALFEAAKDEAAIAWHVRAEVVTRDRGPHGVAVTLADGTVLEGSLLVAAEGRQSPTRDEAGFGLAKWDYSHRAIVSALWHEKPHEGVAWEIFYPDGPFALLPLLDENDGNGNRHRSALVWTVAEKDAAGITKLPDSIFVGEVAKAMHSVFGKIELAAPRMSYPLRFHHSGKLVDNRLVLIGDAAHGMHPIAGQGLNLGLRDVGALVEVLADGMRLGLEPGDAQLLDRYERWRSLDTFMVMSVTDGLNRLFGIPGKLPSAARRLGMSAVQRITPVKTFFMNEARGMSGQLPELLRD
ncbi:UbiH/UbiF/VisC/COQ6 family ubiquinone biosynthesis hydroxylase [Novosphingobium aquimarinum]|uniref:UbiH/UbiF/VisC/COQ6 family ubiquinone biosynthesis hydroxylase n=1 Tax=Novosphingobium aquimarinum TaxID=2682494 RepID=UPI0012EC99E3|nr:UbiH/UbiF/VisC/COQ6 family ubiquinone biosynthesis hydroxylase [Novosphingobium aquimarinum]